MIGGNTIESLKAGKIAPVHLKKKVYGQDFVWYAQAMRGHAEL